jgi:predicted nucleotide-binding protein
VQAELADCIDRKVWTEASFVPSENNLQSLIGATRRFDFGIFIFCCDDARLVGRKRQYVPPG